MSEQSCESAQGARLVIESGPHEWRQASFSRVKRVGEVVESASFRCSRCGAYRHETTTHKLVCKEPE